jgi:hypothetical protein
MLPEYTKNEKGRVFGSGDRIGFVIDIEKKTM